MSEFKPQSKKPTLEELVERAASIWTQLINEKEDDEHGGENV